MAMLSTPCPRTATETTMSRGARKQHKLVNWPGGGTE